MGHRRCPGDACVSYRLQHTLDASGPHAWVVARPREGPVTTNALALDLAARRHVLAEQNSLFIRSQEPVGPDNHTRCHGSVREATASVPQRRFNKAHRS